MAVILLVDDERSVLNLLNAVLRTSGHQVLTAANGLEGLAVFRSYTGLIDLVITDIKMPVMDGFELVGRIRESKPNVKIICMSGYADQELPKGVAFLPKPFLPNDVRGFVDRALSRGP
jgi:two-component system cell cycle sensor histidine kinase/response regulator CckA